jgi:hypothetical protein
LPLLRTRHEEQRWIARGALKAGSIVCLVIAEPTLTPPETVGRGFHLYGGFRSFTFGSVENRILAEDSMLVNELKEVLGVPKLKEADRRRSASHPKSS